MRGAQARGLVASVCGTLPVLLALAIWPWASGAAGPPTGGPLVQELSRPPVFAQFTTAFTWHDRVAQGYDEAAHGPLGAVTIEADWLWELHAQIELLQRQQCEDVLTYVLPDGTVADLEAPLVLGLEHDVELWFQVRVLTMGGAEILRLGGPEDWRFLAVGGASDPWHLWRDWTPDQRLDYAGSGGHHEVWSGTEARAVTVTDPGVLAALSGASSVRVIVSGNYNADQAWTGPKLTRWDPVHLQLSGGLTAGVTASSNTYRRGWDLRLTYHPQED